MFTFLKGYGTKVIVTAVCVVVIILGSTVAFLYRSNNNKLVENGALKSNVATMQQNEVFTEKSAKITDTVVSSYVEQTTKANIASEKLRKESINEYVKPVAPYRGQVSEDERRDSDDERVAKLANRLLENYCRIRPEDTDCRALNPTPGLSHR